MALCEDISVHLVDFDQWGMSAIVVATPTIVTAGQFALIIGIYQ
jgi:hypothetical protein